MTFVKLCGLMSEQDAAAAADAGADAAGMILTPGYRRSVTRAEAQKIRNALGANIRLCGVFVNAALEEIASFAADGLIDYTQLHGSEDNEYIRRLKQICPKLPVIKAFVVKGPEDIQATESSAADLVLLDGGTGQGLAFDRSYVSGMNRPFILAGGLTPDNVSQAVRELHPFAVDTSSGIETNGKKDPAKMKAFVQNAKMEDSGL